MATPNFPLLSIILYWILAIWPHGHAVVLASKGNLSRHDNRNPKASSYTESVKKRLGAKEFAAWERAESCHRNHLENMPLFCAAIFAGLLAERQIGASSRGLNEFAGGWLVIRVLYTINYLRTDTLKGSYIRSVLWYIGSFWAIYVIGAAAFALGT
ncbi:hypothetical protein BDY17DRAFT_142608 [Neohortaea acidophila]|uniref:Membrane-associated, eicosanoid/glutathione metabolism protein n=1 Tax=Neohortaea acidophila TaxID=245834 RepID=A0A6A6PU03_9PEZI|nr:uncharacterized protein BDY17DRAFT_142608 [Neohortaea acidophila]KAF2483164.1 hypothetical protein BDY17DRAFT_142608 [Neohortaea acidophila]